MKKIGLLTTLLVGGLLLTGCNKTVENPEITDYCEGEECKDSYSWNIEDLYGDYILVGFNKEATNIPATLTITEDLIGAKFCNDMGSDNYSIEGNTIHVNNMVQNLMACDSEKLMEYESKFDLSNAKISLVERSLRFTTSNGDIYDFFKSDAQIPSFEELEDVVATCHVEDMGGYDYDVLKNQYILPYKDGYIGYGFGGNGGAWGYYLKYSSLDNPCEVIATTDEFFIWHADYFHEVEEFNNDEYPDDKLYVAQGGWSGIPIDTVAKELNCVAGKDRMEDDTCKKEVDRYMYNLIIGNEQNEVFTKWMNKFKNDIDNGNYTNRKVRNENRNTCNSKNSWESLMEEYGEDNRNLSEEKRREYRKIQINRIHECLESLNLGLIER